MIPKILIKNVFQIVTLLTNLVIVCRPWDHNLKFYSICMIHENICILMTYKSQVVKLNPANKCLQYFMTGLHFYKIYIGIKLAGL